MPQSDSSLGNRITYVNGDYVAARDAQISIFDRGFLFGDGIYEVTAVLGGKLVDNGPHMARLQRSLGEINIPLPLDIEAITAVQHELVRRNNLVEGLIYLQITRGCAGDRDFLSSPELRPSLVMFTQNKALINS
ncbi:D-amino acid aminotransferase, partial [Paraburkholderia aspalathi]|nr:D-amino acid aminotransferase [Paraburkholderia aspalathi]